MRMAELRTELLFTAAIEVAATADLGSSPLGERRMVPILGGSFEGAKIKGKILPGGIDWQLVRADHVTEIEAHYCIETDDGVLIRVINKGFRHGPAEVMQRLRSGQPVDPAEYYFRAIPTLEAPCGRYEWLNKSLFVSSGERSAETVLLRMYEVL
jgi:hypothetical protein